VPQTGRIKLEGDRRSGIPTGTGEQRKDRKEECAPKRSRETGIGEGNTIRGVCPIYWRTDA